MLLQSPRFSALIQVSILIGLVILIGYGTVLIKHIVAANPTIPIVSYCDLVGDPMRYDQATVQVTAIHVVGFEWSYLIDSECSEQTWTILVPNNPACSVDIPTPSLPVNRHGGTRVITVVGQFHGEHGGFGHLGQYPYKFNVICVEKAGSFIPWEAP